MHSLSSAAASASASFMVRRRLHDSTNISQGTLPTSIQSPSEVVHGRDLRWCMAFSLSTYMQTSSYILWFQVSTAMSSGFSNLVINQSRNSHIFRLLINLSQLMISFKQSADIMKRGRCKCVVFSLYLYATKEELFFFVSICTLTDLKFSSATNPTSARERWRSR